MTKKERVRAVIAGEKPDRVPVGFWYHFPPEEHQGDAAVRAHGDFLKQTDVDLLKIMNENLYRVPSPPQRAADWRSLTPTALSADFYTRQLELVRRVLDSVGDSAYTLITIHGVFASAFHALQLPEERFVRENPVERHIAEEPEAVAQGLRTIAESLIEFSQACIRAGVDAVYYAALGGERWRSFSSGAFEQVVKANDVVVLDALFRENADVFVHICKPDVDFTPYADYPGSVFNWATHANDLSLGEGHELFQRTVLGGFDDRSGVLVDGPPARIAEEARSIVARHSDIPFVLGADCTLPTNLDASHIRAAVEAVREVE